MDHDPILFDLLASGKAALPQLGFAPDDDDDDSLDVGAVSEENFIEYLSGLAEDLEMGAVDPFRRMRAAAKIKRVVNFAPQSPKIQRALGPTLNVLRSVGTSLVSKAKSTAANYRVTQSMEVLSGPNHKTNIHIENLATATPTGTITVTAPYSGQPFRLIDMNCECRTLATAAIPATEAIAVGFSSFALNGVERVSNGNVAISAGAVGTAKWDLVDFSARNPHASRRKVYPWGTGPTTWLSPDAKITFAIRNDCGTPINASIALLWQATPCNPRDSSVISKDIVSPREHGDLFRQLLRFRPYRFDS